MARTSGSTWDVGLAAAEAGQPVEQHRGWAAAARRGEIAFGVVLDVRAFIRGGLNKFKTDRREQVEQLHRRWIRVCPNYTAAVDHSCPASAAVGQRFGRLLLHLCAGEPADRLRGRQTDPAMPGDPSVNAVDVAAQIDQQWVSIRPNP